MTDLEMWSGLVALGLPLLIAVIQQPRFTGAVRVLVMVVSCVVASVVTTSLQGDLDWHRWFHSGLVVLIGTIVFYHGVWQPAMVAPNIEVATSPRADRNLRRLPQGDRGASSSTILVVAFIALVALLLGLAISKWFLLLCLVVLVLLFL